MRSVEGVDERLKAGRVGVAARATGLRALKGLWPFMRPYRSTIVLALAALLVAAAAGLGLPVGVRLVIDEGFSARRRRSDRPVFPALVRAHFCPRAFLGDPFLSGVLARRAGGRRHSHGVYRARHYPEPDLLRGTRTGEVLSRLTADTTLVQSVAGVNLSITLRSLVTLAGGLTMLAVTSPRLTAVILLLIPRCCCPCWSIGRRVRALTRTPRTGWPMPAVWPGETLNAIQTVQAFTLESQQARRLEHAVTAPSRRPYGAYAPARMLTAFAIIIVFGAIVFVLWLGAQAVIDGAMSAGRAGPVPALSRVCRRLGRLPERDVGRGATRGRGLGTHRRAAPRRARHRGARATR